jgi:hypothetical protein
LAVACDRGIVRAVTRNPFDNFGKQMLRAALEEHGRVDTDTDVPAEARKIDVCFMPTAIPVPLPEDLGLLGRMAADPGTFEFFHHTPGVGAIGGCLIKHGEFRQFLAGRKTPPPTPTQWVISSGRPKSGIAGYWLRPMPS